MHTTTPLDYQELRSISPQAARQAILQILKANKGRVAPTARVFNITRATVYKAIAKRAVGWTEPLPLHPNERGLTTFLS